MSVEVYSPQEFSSEVSELSTIELFLVTGRLGVRTGSSLRWPSPNKMFGFSAELRSMTHRKGEYTMEYSLRARLP